MATETFSAEFDRDVYEYTEAVTSPDGQERQLGGTHEYTFHEGGNLGRIWLPYDDANITFNIDSGKTLSTSSSYTDSLEVSSGAHLSINGGNFTSSNSSPNAVDSAINIRTDGSLSAEVENFTAISGDEAALKLMSESTGTVTASIHASEDIRLFSGGTGLAMEAYDEGGTVSADITAKNILISSSEDSSLPRLEGIYLMAYYPSSKTLDLTMDAEETLWAAGQKYGLAGWGDTNVSLRGGDISLSASRDEAFSGKGIFLDSRDKEIAEGRGVVISAENILQVDGYYGVRMLGEAGLDLSGKSISISGVYAAHALWDQAHASITADTISMQGEEYTALVYNSASLDMKASTVNFNTNGSVTSYAAYVYGENAALTIQGKNNSYAKIIANGYIKSTNSGSFTMYMGKDSVYSGYTSITNAGEIVLNLDGNARWNVVRSSSLSSLNFNNALPVDIDLRADGGSIGTTLTVNSVRGAGGTFYVDTGIEEDRTDQIIIGHGEGSHRLYVSPSGVEPSREAMATFIVQQQEGSGSFSLANAGGRVEHGLYLYELADRSVGTDGREWYLRRAVGASGQGDKTPTGETVLGLSGMASAYAMWMGQLSDLRERLGEIRYGNGKDGLWVRGFTQENRLSGLDGVDFSQNFYGTSFGYDRLVEQDDDNTWLFGLRGQITRAEQRIDSRHDGSGDSRSYGVAAYATWQHSDGWYADTVLSWDWYDQNLRTRMLDGTRVYGFYTTYGGGISQEFGRMFRFDNGFFVEPQLQLSWYWMKGTDFTTSNGMDVDQDDACALTGRAGLVLGRKWDMDEERYIQPYLKGGVKHEFLGDQTVTVNGVKFSDDLRGTRVYYGAGVDLQFAENARLYAEFEREDGVKAATPWSISAGLRVEF